MIVVSIMCMCVLGVESEEKVYLKGFFVKTLFMS